MKGIFLTLDPRMPLKADHLTQARQNLALLDFLATHSVQQDFSDWYVTVSFYTAVHVVEATIYEVRRLSVQPNVVVEITHSERAKPYYQQNSPHILRLYLLRDNPQVFGDCYDHYATLYEMSRTARYECGSPSSFNCRETREQLDAVCKGCEPKIGPLS